jgi:hypothetical protein
MLYARPSHITNKQQIFIAERNQIGTVLAWRIHFGGKCDVTPYALRAYFYIGRRTFVCLIIFCKNVWFI